MKLRSSIRFVVGLALGVLGPLFVLNGSDHGFRTVVGLIWASSGVLLFARGVIEIRTALTHDERS